jgi:hypothetical protein
MITAGEAREINRANTVTVFDEIDAAIKTAAELGERKVLMNLNRGRKDQSLNNIIRKAGFQVNNLPTGQTAISW